MSFFVISVEAENDLDEITEFTKQNWGWRQAQTYLRRLEGGIHLIAQHPSIGRPCDSVRDGLRRFEVGRHVVFYAVESERVLIARILHENMLPANYV